MRFSIATYNIHKGFSHLTRRMVIHELRERLHHMDADVLFPREFLRRLLGVAAPSALLIDRGFKDTGEEVKLYTRGDRVIALGKKLVPEAWETVGEGVGFFKCGAAAGPEFIRAMEQVAGPVVAVGVVLSAVFIPCAFLSGIVGQFFRQFALTIAVSTLISTFNSLTLSPALCALLLKPKGARPDLPTRVTNVLFGWFFRGFNRLFRFSGRVYVRAVGLGLRGFMMGGIVQRPAPGVDPPSRAARWVDTLGHDSAYDYDPLWARCVEHGQAVGARQAQIGHDHVVGLVPGIAEPAHGRVALAFLVGVAPGLAQRHGHRAP